MAQESKSNDYVLAGELAEAGQYDKAVALLKKHLQANPDDGVACNDLGTILYCMNRGDEAIGYFQKAAELCLGDELLQVYMNLSEAYIVEERPNEAVSLFDKMQKLNILTADTVNRTGNLFLLQEDLSSALEVLLYSLHLWPGQDVLYPMIEVILGKRARIAIVAGRDSHELGVLDEYLGKRFNVRSMVCENVGQVQSISQWADICLYVGGGEVVRQAVSASKKGANVVYLGSGDFANEAELMDWRKVDTLIVPDYDSVRAGLEDVFGSLLNRPIVLRVKEFIDLKSLTYADRKKGKRLAAVGPWDAASNPMQLIQCMQKLHYIDSDYRLYMAGEFVDKATEVYVRHMISELELEHVVMLDGAVKNMNSWLKDKHYIVSAAMSIESVSNVLARMACGLKPVVHNVPGMKAVLGEACLFNSAEQFCEQVLSENYDSYRYRAMVEERFMRSRPLKMINECLRKYEQKCQSKAAEPVMAVPMNNTMPSVQPQRPVTPVTSVAPSLPQVQMPRVMPAADTVQRTMPTMPKPVMPLPTMTRLTSQVAPAMPIAAVPAEAVSNYAGEFAKPINQVAEEALKTIESFMK